MTRHPHHIPRRVLRILLVVFAVHILLLAASGASPVANPLALKQRDTTASADKVVPLEKRGGKGVDRHLIAGATAATFATLTALLTVAGNSIKAHDQNRYGVSRKDAAIPREKSSPTNGTISASPESHLVRRAGLKGRLHGLDPYQKVFEKVEDYGKMGASFGAVTAASVATYSALQAHRAYVLKASKDGSNNVWRQDNSTRTE